MTIVMAVMLVMIATDCDVGLCCLQRIVGTVFVMLMSQFAQAASMEKKEKKAPDRTRVRGQG